MNDKQIEALRIKYGFDRIGIIQGEMYLPIKDVFEKLVQRWIPCSERLPEKRQKCLTTEKIYFVPDHVDEPDYYIGVAMNTYSEEFGWLNNIDVIAWMPLPESYQEEGEGHE